jgi:hypothetical protein
MMPIWFYVLLSLWGGAVWRARGGAFHALTGIDIGDFPTRAVAALLIGLPAVLASRNDWAILMPAALFLGLGITSWGGFMAVGQSPNEEPRAIVTPALEAVGFKRGTVPYDLAGLFLNGIILLLFVAPILWLVWGWASVALLLISSAVAMPASYGIARFLPPLGKVVDTNTVWGEVFYGAFLAPALFLAFNAA